MKTKRKNLSRAIAHLMPEIIQGAHFGLLSEEKITHTQFFVLAAVHAKSRCAMSTLAQNVQVSMPTISGIVDRLAKAKYIQRTTHAQDRRQIIIELTPKGHALITKFQKIIMDRWNEILGSLSDQEMDAFSKIILKLTQSLKEDQ